jgi:hypothetical protein
LVGYVEQGDPRRRGALPNMKRAYPLALFAILGLNGCGSYVPAYDLFLSDTPEKPGDPSPQGQVENDTVAHIRCEIGNALVDILDAPNLGPRVKWLKDWGTTVTIKLTVDEMSNLTPGVSSNTPFENEIIHFSKGGNITAPQSFAIGLGASGSAHATRLETITYTYANEGLYEEVRKNRAIGNYGTTRPCDDIRNGLVVQGDLKIEEFLYDKATVSANREASNANPNKPPFSTLSNDLTFVSSFGGSVDPVWKLARFTGNTSPTLFNATRGRTNELLLTMAPINKEQTKKQDVVVLIDIGIAVHNASLIGSATGTANQAQIRE